MKMTFDHTYNAAISCVVSRNGKVAIFFDYFDVEGNYIDTVVFSFDPKKPGDKAQLKLLCEFGYVPEDKYHQLDEKSFRIVLNPNPNSNAHGIGHAEKDLFFLISGHGERRNQKGIYKALYYNP